MIVDWLLGGLLLFLPVPLLDQTRRRTSDMYHRATPPTHSIVLRRTVSSVGLNRVAFALYTGSAFEDTVLAKKDVAVKPPRKIRHTVLGAFGSLHKV